MNRNGILWVGANQSRYWPRQQTPDWAVVAMPLNEASVLRTAFDATYTGYRRLSRTAALAATSRLAQRVALASTGLNPKWQPCPWQSGVVKAPTSVENQGVGYLPANWYTRNLRRYARELSSIGVVEEWLEGEAWEQDGYIVKGQLGWFWPLRQHWDPRNTKIRKYQRAKTLPGPDGLRESTAIVVRTIGLADCCFCAEWRLTKNGWRLIEIQARLGQDEGLAELMVDGGKPLQTVESVVREAYGVPAEPAPRRIVAAGRRARSSSVY